jgi:replicative DNA helicase
MGELHASGERDIPVWSVDHDYRIVRATMSHVFSTGVKETFRLKLASGRQVDASANHPFLTYAGWARLDELEVGSRLAVPRSIPEPAQTSVWDDHEVILLAHLLGDGCVAPRQPIHYTSNDPANLDAVELAARNLFGISPRRVAQKTWWHTYLPAPQKLTHGKRNPIAQWLDERFGLYGKRSHERFIPAEVFSLKDPQVALFLRHLWATDGHLGRRDRTVTCYYATTSRRLADDLQLLLLRFGIHSRLRTVDNGAQRTGYQLWISGHESTRRFLEGIGVHGRRGAQADDLLSLLAEVQPNPNGDTVPAAVWGLVKDRLRERGMSHRQFAEAMGTASWGNAMFKSSVSRTRLSRAADVLEDEGLRLLATSDLYWDRVVAIEPLGPQEVFDATVHGTHNFISGNIVLENSIEQDADIVAFIYRDEVYNPDTAAKGEAELIVSKHRSGPLKTIHLAFLGPRRGSRTCAAARAPAAARPARAVPAGCPPAHPPAGRCRPPRRCSRSGGGAPLAVPVWVRPAERPRQCSAEPAPAERRTRPGVLPRAAERSRRARRPTGRTGRRMRPQGGRHAPHQNRRAAARRGARPRRLLERGHRGLGGARRGARRRGG